MIRRAVAVVICALVFSAFDSPAQEEILATFTGRVFADRGPVDWMLQVRLEREDSSLIANAYTRGSFEFKFERVILKRSERFFLVIDEPGYKPVRYPFDTRDLRRDPLTGYYTNSSMFILSIESLPKEGAGRDLTGPKVIDARQIEAQREYDLATEDFKTGNTRSALAHLEKVVELSPKYHDSINKLGAEYLKAGEYEKAEAVLIRARDLDPEDPVALTNLGSLYFQRGEKLTEAGNAPESEPAAQFYRKAVEVLEQALRLEPQAARIGFYLGTALYRVGDYKKAETLLINALVRDRQLNDARVSLINMYVRQKRYEDALDQISDYLEVDPNAPQGEQLRDLREQIEDEMEEDSRR